jgi:hypothetical protein
LQFSPPPVSQASVLNPKNHNSQRQKDACNRHDVATILKNSRNICGPRNAEVAANSLAWLVVVREVKNPCSPLVLATSRDSSLRSGMAIDTAGNQRETTLPRNLQGGMGIKTRDTQATGFAKVS